MPEEWRAPSDSTAWYKTALDNRLQALGRLVLVTTLLTGLAAAAIMTPIASSHSWPGSKATFHVFLVCVALSFVSLLSSTVVLSLVIWLVHRELSIDAYIASTGKLPGFEIGFGAWRVFTSFTYRSKFLGLKINLVTISGKLAGVGIFSLVGAFVSKVLASLDGETDITVFACIAISLGAVPLLVFLPYILIISSRQAQLQQQTLAQASVEAS
eukprot:TRINITY_DN16630_c0_g1_i2.p1 TRINITY_DN16630_c0_g1~~TRINITY_DN16630_c0_g1_i2.p1  ORF type:complete len:226 (+),score=39.84 TRINITY_DN16630_c0_g1_i2:42-680(+)